MDTTALLLMFSHKHSAGAAPRSHVKVPSEEIDPPPDKPTMSFKRPARVKPASIRHPRSGGMNDGMSVRWPAGSSRSPASSGGVGSLPGVQIAR